MIAYLVGEFPSRTEHFIYNEMVHVRNHGQPILVLSIKKGYRAINSADKIVPIYARPFLMTIGAHMRLLLKQTGRYLNTLWWMLRCSDPSVYALLRRIKIFSIGVDLLSRLRKSDVQLIHAHFISFPTDVARVMSGLSGIPFSASAHAKDIYTCKPEKLEEILQSASFVITCTAANKKYLERAVAAGQEDKIIHIYHGIDHRDWTFLSRQVSGRIRILSIGRLVEKKGLRYLLRAISLLKQDNHAIHCTIVGDGPLRSAFQMYIDQQNLGDVITLRGELPHEAIKVLYAQSDVFVMPSVVASDGDRDGLPNVLLEALCTGLPVIATNVSAIPELIVHESTGLLIPDGEPACIAESVLRLANDKRLYESVARNGLQRISDDFNIDVSTSRLIGVFTKSAKGPQ
jgi:glycosyltransferase involved in cell wall biosynthesis